VGGLEIVPRILNAGAGSPLDINIDLYDQVHVANLSTSPTVISAPTGTPVNGQWLTISFYTPTARTLAWTTTTGGFSAEAGQALPTTTLAGTYLVLHFRYNSLSLHYALVWISRDSAMPVAYTDASVITVNVETTKLATVAALSQPTTFANPVGTPQQGQLWRLAVCSTVPRALSWGSEFRAAYGLDLPVSTTGTTVPGGACDLFGFQRDDAAAKWDLVSTSQSSVSAKRRTCMLVIGADNGPALVDTDLGPQFDQCFVPSSATVEEITIKADAGVPSVIVHRRTSAGVSTALLSGALPTAASGGLACARISPATAGFAGVTCSTTLQNTTVSGGEWFGLTSGTASAAKRVSVAISYLLTN